MAIETWLAFVAASAVLLVIPGPTILLVLSYALGRGWKVAAPVAAGVALGDLTAMTLSMVGVGVLLAKSAALFTALKWIGAAYLIWLGIRLWRAGGALETEARADAGPRWRMLAHAWLVTTLNPKSLIFFIAFLPQFLDPGRPFAPQMAIFEATFVTLAFANAFGYALLGARARRLAASPRAIRLVNRAGGAALISAGAAVGADRKGGLMLKVRVIPCLDVKDGRVVKGVNFEGLRDAGDPVEAARAYDAPGRRRALLSRHRRQPGEPRHAARPRAAGRPSSASCRSPIGGGVRTPEDVRALLLAGADKVSFNSAAVATPDVVNAAADEVRRAVHRGGDRRADRRARALGDLHPWRHAGDRDRRGRVRPRHGGARRGRRSC